MSHANYCTARFVEEKGASDDIIDDLNARSPALVSVLEGASKEDVGGMEDGQELIDIIETVYRGARKGRGLVVSPKDYSTKYRY